MMMMRIARESRSGKATKTTNTGMKIHPRWKKFSRCQQWLSIIKAWKMSKHSILGMIQIKRIKGMTMIRIEVAITRRTTTMLNNEFK